MGPGRGRPGQARGNVLERFVTKVDRSDECWLWTGTPSQEYGQFRPATRERVAAHRFAYEMGCRQIPRGMVVRHRCDTPRCVRPDHLQVGTELDNRDDRMSRNRQAKGSTAGNSKLTEEQVLAIRAEPATARELAVKYEVSKGTIDQIRARKNWRHI